MDAIWVLVADKSRAQLYTGKSRVSELTLEKSWEHEASRSHEQELTSDLPGRAFDSTGANRHAMEQTVDPKDHEAIVFAQQLASEIEKGRSENLFSALYLMAAPQFLGMLRKQLSAEVQKLVAGEVDKNLTQESEERVRSFLMPA